MEDGMAWVTFTDDFDYEPSDLLGRTTIAYKAGMTLSVRRECSDQAIAAGKATIAPTPPLTQVPAHVLPDPISG